MMKVFAKGFLASFAAFGCAVAVQADVKLASLFTDNMVLQREMSVPIWGKASPGEKVAVYFAGQTKEAQAGADGKWLVKLDPLKAEDDPQDLTVKGDNQIVLKNVLVGEVWICSGQSNMEMGIKNVNDADKEIADASNYPTIRLFMVPNKHSATPLDSVEGKWLVCSSDTIAQSGWNGFSAAGYFFGREVCKRLDVPVGLIEADWGGTPAQAWTPIENLKTDEDFAGYVAQHDRDAEIVAKELAKYDRPVSEILADMQIRVEDPGMKPEAADWMKDGADLSSWEAVKVPSGWFVDKQIYGSIWYRRDIEIPVEEAGKDLQLHLGVVDDFDTTYFNGEKVGAIGKETKEWWTVERVYTVPGNLVKPGRNTIAVRVFNDFGGGGFMSSPKSMKIMFHDGKTIPLAGDWQRKIENALKTFPLIPSFQNSPAFLYNAMIAPLIPYAIRGAVWYQGESNSGRSYEYRKLFPTMIRAWRDKWGQGDFPFYFVQLANFMPEKPEPSESAWAELREAQSLTAANVFNTGMAVIIDIGDAKDIHPKNKQDVGFRLALNALANTYGRDIEFAGPVCRGMKVENGSVRLYFDHVGDGLAAKGGEPLKGFAICGPDHKFVWADAKIDGETVVVSSPEVKDPVSVRYAWADNPSCNLFNEEGLPASPFRTDSFKGVTQK